MSAPNRYGLGQTPLFSQEGPQFYATAYAHNAPYATGGSYQTVLPPDQEQAFRQWVAQNNVPFDPNAQTSDYDMRGYWQNMLQGQGQWSGGHFPDTWKTPYDTSFSSESQYATPGNPFVWQGAQLIDSRTGSVVFDPSGQALASKPLPMFPQPGIGGSRQ